MASFALHLPPFIYVNIFKAHFPGGGESTDLYEKYQQFVVGEEEADWTGLTLQVTSWRSSTSHAFLKSYSPHLKASFLYYLKGDVLVNSLWHCCIKLRPRNFRCFFIIDF